MGYEEGEVIQLIALPPGLFVEFSGSEFTERMLTSSCGRRHRAKGLAIYVARPTELKVP